MFGQFFEQDKQLFEQRFVARSFMEVNVPAGLC
jgi:hypothetical protein